MVGGRRSGHRHLVVADQRLVRINDHQRALQIAPQEYQRHRCANIVTDHKEALDAEMAQQASDVGHDLARAITAHRQAIGPG